MISADLDQSATSDGELLRHFLDEQSEAAFEQLIGRHGPMVLRVCRDLLDELDDADDAFQATFLILVRRARGIRNPEALGPWLYGVATRVCVRLRVINRRRSEREKAGLAMTPPRIDEPGEFTDLQPILHAELDRLPRKLRDPVVLCYFEGHTQERAAQRLRLPLGTLKHRLVKARDLLRSRLSRRSIGVSTALLLAAFARRADAVPESLAQTTVNSGFVMLRRKDAMLWLSPAVARVLRDERRRRWSRRAMLLSGIAVLLGLFWTAHVARGQVPLIAQRIPLWPEDRLVPGRILAATIPHAHSRHCR